MRKLWIIALGIFLAVPTLAQDWHGGHTNWLVNQERLGTYVYQWGNTPTAASAPLDMRHCDGGVDWRYDPSVWNWKVNAGFQLNACTTADTDLSTCDFEKNVAKVVAADLVNDDPQRSAKDHYTSIPNPPSYLYITP